MARPRKQTYPLETYLNSNKDGDISNNADTQRKPAWRTIINGLIVTILTDDYIVIQHPRCSRSFLYSSN